MPPPVHVGKLPPRASTRHSFVIGGTQAGYCVGPPGLEMHRTTSHAQVLSDATAGVDCTAAPTKAVASAKLKAFIAFSLVIEIYAHITMRGKGKPKTRSEEHTSELQSLMRISYAVFCLKKKKKQNTHTNHKTKNHNH